MSRPSSVSEVDPEAYKAISASDIKARFEQTAAESAAPKRNFVINKGGTSEAAKKFNQSPSTSTKCVACCKTVYPMEKLDAEGDLFHKACFKCETCKGTLGLGNYASLQGKYYCKPHIKQLFQLKGNYDEGFGRDQRKSDWVNKDAPVRKSTTPAESKQQQDVEVVEEAANKQEPITNGDSHEPAENGHADGPEIVAGEEMPNGDANEVANEEANEKVNDEANGEPNGETPEPSTEEPNGEENGDGN